MQSVFEEYIKVKKALRQNIYLLLLYIHFVFILFLICLKFYLFKRAEILGFYGRLDWETRPERAHLGGNPGHRSSLAWPHPEEPIRRLSFETAAPQPPQDEAKGRLEGRGLPRPGIRAQKTPDIPPIDTILSKLKTNYR
jgi:hypothetical protein